MVKAKHYLLLCNADINTDKSRIPLSTHSSTWIAEMEICEWPEQLLASSPGAPWETTPSVVFRWMQRMTQNRSQVDMQRSFCELETCCLLLGRVTDTWATEDLCSACRRIWSPECASKLARTDSHSTIPSGSDLLIAGEKDVVLDRGSQSRWFINCSNPKCFVAS